MIDEDGVYVDAKRFLEKLLESDALRLGARIQCPVCLRRNWYELTALKYELVCRFCLSDFATPVNSPRNIEWTYRAHGPFASSIAQGSFTVLLTLRFLSGDISDSAITPLFSYKAENGQKRLEADLTCLHKRSIWRDGGAHVVHAECKSFNLFERGDVDRMADLATAFPGSVLVFSTLNQSLSRSEIKVIEPLVRAERVKRMRGVIYSPIVVLTGIELFSSRGVRDCWKGRGGLYDKFHEDHFFISRSQS